MHYQWLLSTNKMKYATGQKNTQYLHSLIVDFNIYMDNLWFFASLFPLTDSDNIVSGSVAFFKLSSPNTSLGSDSWQLP